MVGPASFVLCLGDGQAAALQGPRHRHGDARGGSAIAKTHFRHTGDFAIPIPLVQGHLLVKTKQDGSSQKVSQLRDW